MRIRRRTFLKTTGLALAAGAGLAPRISRGQEADFLSAELERIERASGGRLGVSVIDTADGTRTGRRGDERFPMCSTFKFLLAGAVLKAADEHRLTLAERVAIAEADLLAHSPITERNLGPRGMSLSQLCEAAVIESDNAAANLLLPRVGGPAGLTAFLRSIGDPLTRSDRTEPTMNQFVPGDPRDTTTPASMADDMRRLVLGDALSPTSRRRLTTWLLHNRTGGARLRAGLPRGWRVGDKTGSNGTDTTNDVAIVWPTGGRAPLIVAVFLNGATVDITAQNAAHAEVARVVARSLAE